MSDINSLGLHKYANNADQQRWVKGKIRTSKFIQTFWRAASARQRQDPRFLQLLVRFGWTNKTKGHPDPASTRRWRNRLIAEYLKLPNLTEAQLADAVHKQFPLISRGKAAALLAEDTGVTHYYTPLRTAALNFVRMNSRVLRRALEIVSAKAMNTREKVARAAELIEDIGVFEAGHRQRVSPFNAITPTMACLDPQRRFPIMNDQTRALLHLIGKGHNSDGVVGLHDFIGQYGIKDSFE